MSNQAFSALQIGHFLVNVLNDGDMTVSLDLLSGINAIEAKKIQYKAGMVKTVIINVNAYLIRGAGRIILVDSGTGGLNGAGGLLLENLMTLGVNPNDIDTILITHAHPDHIGGLLDHEGQVRYKNANLYLHPLEMDYWLDDEKLKHQNERGQRNFSLVRRTLHAYAKSIKFFDHRPIIEGIRPRLLAGHTPGHTGFYVESDDKSLLIWGDIIHFPNIQLADPSITISFDCDPEQAASTRKKILQEVVQNKQLIAGMHIEKQGFAQISLSEHKYHLVYQDN
ncbi:MBL fold metallo-hydrolase [Acinetobacter populi]|uniref:MBL fold metallo-hydrolase n=1 Tax=Acinetobacter populi TaxID=1582270 RepID=A0A1Z9YUQ3_9GAMM|nr:MBL fold metallo-hydrolase [Acinetobacter populi]OUY05956.1 MBL fold metallo-hydrolase [Acinetobacter populi]